MTFQERRQMQQTTTKIAELEQRLDELTEIVNALKPRKRGRPAAAKPLGTVNAV